MEPHIIPADRRLRTQVIVALPLVAAFGLILLWLLHCQVEEIKELADRDLEAAVGRAIGLIGVVSWGSGLGFVGIGLWFGWLGWRIHRCDQFPPPGMRVIKDTPVRTGRKARMIAKLALVSAAIFALGGPAGAWYFYRQAVRLLQP